jgi:hypothetical protein
MTITLQDVSCLWALPIMGSPVTGRSDGEWYTLADELLGAGTASAVFKKKKRSEPNDLNVVHMTSKYAINLKLLYNRFAAMPAEPTDEQVRQYTRAYVLDLFGSMFFADTSGDSVPAMYLQFLQNLDVPDQYNWGGAVLAYLYRSLCAAVQRKTKTMSGPTVLLQHWCWSHLPTGRPRSLHSWAPDWRKPDDQECPAFGEKWCCLHDYHVGHNRSGVSYFRNELQKLEDYMVIWEPYREMLLENPNALSLRVNQESGVWLARVPLVHFWMIEHHYPDRVMRQFGYSQVIPPPLPLAEDEVRRLHKIVHSAMSGRESWSVMHQTYVEQASNPADHLVVPTGYWSNIEILPYRYWFQNHCMFNIFLGKRCIEGLDNPIPQYRDEIGEIGYIPSAPKSTRDVSFTNLKIAYLMILFFHVGNHIFFFSFPRDYEG